MEKLEIDLRMFKKSFKVVIIKAKMYVKKLKSLQSEPSNSNSRQSALVLPLLEKFFVRDFSNMAKAGK